MSAIFVSQIAAGDVVAARRRPISCHEGALYEGRVLGHGWDTYHEAPTVHVECTASSTSWFTREFRASELVYHRPA